MSSNVFKPSHFCLRLPARPNLIPHHRTKDKGKDTLAQICIPVDLRYDVSKIRQNQIRMYIFHCFLWKFCEC